MQGVAVKLEELAGEHLDGRYALESLIGTGGYGAVFEAMQLSVQRPCAVKVLSPSLCDDETSLERFENEARMTARLKHPHTVRIFDYGRDDDLGVVFLVMELLEGVSLKHRVRTGGPLSLAATLDVVDAVAQSLDEAHEMGMVHRDVKPHNIMLTRRGGRKDFVKVIDFGIAKALGPTAEDRELTATGMMIGTPTFMAPEQIRSADIDGRCDQYALAVTVYYMLTGETPFRGASTLEAASRHLTESAPALSAFKPQLDLPRLFDAVLLKALAKAPEARFETMAAFAEALRGAFDGEIPEGPGIGLVPASNTPAEGSGQSPSASLQATRMTTPAISPDQGSTLATVALDAAAGQTVDGPPSPPRPYSIRPLVTFAVLGLSLALVGLGSTAMSSSPGEPQPREFGVAQDREPRPPAETDSVPEDSPGPETSSESAPVNKLEPDSPKPALSAEFAEAVQSAVAARDLAATRAETSADDAATAARTKSAKRRQPTRPETPATGIVQATLIPWGDLFADGKRLGRGSRIRTELPAGRHTLEMRQGERSVGTKVVRIRPGQTTTVEMVAK